MKWEVTVVRVGSIQVEADSQVEALIIVHDDVETKDIQWADDWGVASADKVIEQ